MTAPRGKGPGALSAAIAHRLSRAGFDVATEVEVGGGRWRGFVDLLAMHPAQRLLLVIEVKTELDDLGAVDRQLGSYVGGAWIAAASLKWRPRGVTGLLILLATRRAPARLSLDRGQDSAQPSPRVAGNPTKPPSGKSQARPCPR